MAEVSDRSVSRSGYPLRRKWLYCEHEPVNRVYPSGAKPVIEDWEKFLDSLVVVTGGAALVFAAPMMPPVCAGGALLFGSASAIGAGLVLGDWIAEELFPPEEMFILAPSNRELERYRREIESGWLEGSIPKPPHPRYHPQPV